MLVRIEDEYSSLNSYTINAVQYSGVDLMTIIYMPSIIKVTLVSISYIVVGVYMGHL